MELYLHFPIGLHGMVIKKSNCHIVTVIYTVIKPSLTSNKQIPHILKTVNSGIIAV